MPITFTANPAAPQLLIQVPFRCVQDFVRTTREEFKREVMRLMKAVVNLLPVNANNLYRWRGQYGSRGSSRSDLKVGLKRMTIWHSGQHE